MSGYRAVNAKKAAMPMPDLDALARFLERALLLYMLDMLQDYYQMQLNPPSKLLFTMVSSGVLYTPRGMPQVMLNVVAYFQGVMKGVL